MRRGFGALRGESEENMSDRTRVGDVMSREVHTIEMNERALDADRLMKMGRIRHLPVVDEDGSLVGLVTQRDLFHNALLRSLGYGAHGQEKLLDMTLVKETMRSVVFTTTPDASLESAAQTLFNEKIGCLVVLDGDSIVGILSEGDFVKLAAG